MTGPGRVAVGRALVKVTVNLKPRAVEAFDAATDCTRDSKTDVINRASIGSCWSWRTGSGGHVVFVDADGQRERAHLL